MRKLKIKIQKMLSKSVLVSAEQKQQISRNLDKYSTDQLEVMYSFLTEAAVNQKTLLWNALKSNPKFEKEIEKSEVAGDRTKSLSNLMGEIFISQKEDKIKSLESKEIDDLEQKLANI